MRIVLAALVAVLGLLDPALAQSIRPSPSPSPRPISTPQPRPISTPQPRPSPMPISRPSPAPISRPIATPQRPSPTPRPIATPSPRIDNSPRPIARPSPTPSYPQPRVDRPVVTQPRYSNPTPSPVAPRPVDQPRVRVQPAPTQPVQPGPSTGYRPPVRSGEQPRIRVPGPGVQPDSRTAPSPAPDYRAKLRDLYDRRPEPTVPGVKPGTPRPVDAKPIGAKPIGAQPVDSTGGNRARLRPVPTDGAKPGTTAPVVDGARRSAPPAADRRYPVPGRSAPAPAAPVDQPKLRSRDGRTDLPGTRGDVVGRVAPTTPRVVPPRSSPPPASGSPRLNPPPTHRGGTTWPTPIVNNPRYDGSTYSGSCNWFWGSWQWGGHCAVFGPSYARWGCYSYPYYYSNWWCRNWYDCNSSFSLWWSSCSPSYGYASYSSWWWPTNCYLPGTWLGSMSFADWCPDYVDWGWSPPTSTYVITTRIEGSGGATPVEEPAADTRSPEEKAAENLRTLADRHLRLGDWYFRQGRFAEAAESYTRALAYAPDDGSIHFVIADALFATADYHYAAFMIRKALDFDPDLAKADADKRAFYDDPSLFDAQLAALQKYCGEKPYDAAAHLVLGYNLRFSGRSLEAAASFRRVLEIAPGDSAARAFLEALAAAGSPAPVTPTPPADAGAAGSDRK